MIQTGEDTIPNGVASSHYLGMEGTQYYEAKFCPAMQRGREFQLRYFRPYCSDQTDLLDFGCADGLSLRSLPARRRVGIEVNPVAVARCRELLSHNHPAIELLPDLADVEPESIDLAISNHCLEHVPQPLTALNHVRRVLRPGGRLILVTPFDDWRNSKGRAWRADDIDRHLYTWSPMNVGNLVCEAGLQCISTTLATCAWSPKFFPVRDRLGETVFLFLCWLNSVIKRRREVICHARKPS
jgi:SAM-dependent methyltransferase